MCSGTQGHSTVALTVRALCLMRFVLVTWSFNEMAATGIMCRPSRANRRHCAVETSKFRAGFRALAYMDEYMQSGSVCIAGHFICDVTARASNRLPGLQYSCQGRHNVHALQSMLPGRCVVAWGNVKLGSVERESGSELRNDRLPTHQPSFS